MRALARLQQDTVRATCWDLPEQEALLLERLMRSSEGDSAPEQGWLLRELRTRFELSIDELAQRFDRSASWVSGRLGLVNDLPEAIQEQVRRGRLVPHAAMKYLLPLARSNRAGAIELAAAIAPMMPSSRQTEALCVAFARGTRPARRHVLEHSGALSSRARGKWDRSRCLWVPESSSFEMSKRSPASLGGHADIFVKKRSQTWHHLNRSISGVLAARHAVMPRGSLPISMRT